MRRKVFNLMSFLSFTYAIGCSGGFELGLMDFWTCLRRILSALALSFAFWILARKKTHTVRAVKGPITNNIHGQYITGRKDCQYDKRRII